MISKKIAKKILELGLETGADFSELYIEDSYSHTINYDNMIVESIGSTSSKGIGIRLLKGNKSLYGYTNEFKEKSLVDLVNKLASGFSDKKTITVKDFIDSKVKNISPIKNSYFSTSNEEKIKILKHISETMKNYSPKIVRTVALFLGDKKDIEIFNSDGLHKKDYKERVRIIMMPHAADNDKHESSFGEEGQSGGMDFINLDKLDTIARATAKEAVGMLDAKDCPAGNMTVIVGKRCGGVLFHEACGHSLEATAVADNMSVFANRLGDTIASDIVNAYDDGTIPNKWGSNNIDDEGNPTQRTCLIKNGILTNYLIDAFNGRKLNKPANGCSRRNSYKYEPTSRMSNTFIDNGTSSKDEIIANTKLGLYAKKFAGGSVSPVTGEFEFGALVAYIVRDGKVAEQVKGAVLIGKGEEVLKNIDMIGNDLDLDTGFCGSKSGYVPVCTGQPTIRVKNLLVGGSGGKLQ